MTSSDTTSELDGLGLSGKILVILVLCSWCIIFLFGILVDTEPYRKAISTSGFTKSQISQQPADKAGDQAVDEGKEPPYSGNLGWAWLVVFFCFTPNLPT